MINKKIKIPWWEPKIGQEEYRLIRKALKNNFPNEGPLTELFEKKISTLVGCKYAVVVTSGTSAIFISLKTLGVGYGDEVIVPDITFISTANAVEMCGAKPIFVDVDRKTLQIDPQSFEGAITKKTKSVIPVHVSGRSADIKAIMRIAEENNIEIIEDAAEAFMSKYNGKYLGTFGKLGCFSFSPHKTITTGQGGAIITDDEELYIRLRELKDQGRFSRGTGGDDIHNSVGYNFKFTDLQAAVGLGQLNYLKTRMERLKRNCILYNKNLKDIDGISLFDCDIKRGELPLWTDALVKKRNQLDEFLRKKGIDCRRFWFPVHTQKPYKLSDDHFPNSTKLSRRALWLPSGFTLSDEDIFTVCNQIKKFIKK